MERFDGKADYGTISLLFRDRSTTCYSKRYGPTLKQGQFLSLKMQIESFE